MVPRSITTRRTGAAVVRSDARPTALTPPAVAVRSSTTDIIPAALTGELISGPFIGAAPDTFATALLDGILDAVGAQCMTTGRADVAMGCCMCSALVVVEAPIAAVATRTNTPLRCVVIAEASSADNDIPFTPLPHKDPDLTEAPAADENKSSDKDKP